DKDANLSDVFRLYPVGRLDKDSEGLVLLTNDGELTNVLTHPRFEHEKEYEIQIDDHLSRDAKKVLEKGMKLDDEFVQGITIVNEKRIGRRHLVRVILAEGKNRQIRRMFGRLGYHVVMLRRVRMGKLSLGSIPQGKWKFVKKSQIV
ncbi:rRNA pseudouridine synthase, partial [Candidatus Nomurabacteria bacterium]|nr:rRNA pseudouridine synthase [Candidatus Nomurabacteria bacterium]